MSTVKTISVINDLIGVSIQLLERAIAISHVLSNAQAEGRELTDDEWSAIMAADNDAKDRLKRAIESKQ